MYIVVVIVENFVVDDVVNAVGDVVVDVAEMLLRLC